ncbi:MAG: FAD-dependent monooxygenase [Beijerinckiaceae bacterium]|jgi:2-polyprenyl-6-methoxyphenol hydroxylase-like FAD-dependent oxidoreductase|nr:FAD-dependent monooxygenase [Beijerinckiaceae bacterium]
MADNPNPAPIKKARAGQPLIVGAGPTGLAAALNLAQAGHAVRIIDRNPAPTSESRAIVITHRTLDMLRDLGVSDKFVSMGHIVRGLILTVNGQNKAQIDFEFIPHKLKGLLVVPQNFTERILSDALREMGYVVERRTELTRAEMDTQGGNLQLKTGDAYEATHVSWLIGADGEQSFVRQLLDTEMKGSAEEHHWSVVDIDLGPKIDSKNMEICLAAKMPALIRIPLGKGKHRVISNAPEVTEMIPEHWRPGGIHWQSDVVVHHQQAERRIVGRAVIIGDAAHQMSPLAGRNLSLGIEDAISLTNIINDVSRISPSMITPKVEEQLNHLFRAWERERLGRSRYAMWISNRVDALVTERTGWELFKLAQMLRFIGLLPSVQRVALALLADLSPPEVEKPAPKAQ